jgi:hypothetical protein
MTGWIPLTVSVAAALGVTAAGAVGVATLRWNGDTRELRTHLFEADPTALAPFDPRELAAARAPVARYFARVLTPGQRLIARASIEWAGEFNMGRPGADKWTHCTAVQDFLPSEPRKAWQGRIMSVTTRDGMTVPDESVVEWLLPSGVYAYWRARPTTIAYTYAPPAAPPGGL